MRARHGPGCWALPSLRRSEAPNPRRFEPLRRESVDSATRGDNLRSPATRRTLSPNRPMPKSKPPALRAALRVRPGDKPDLASFDASETFGRTKADSDAAITAGLARLTDVQDRLWAEGKHPVLVVLQGIDAAGKDGTIKHVMSAF